MQKHLLAYDADCSVCTTFKRAVVFLDVNQRLDTMPIGEADGLGLLHAIPSNLRGRSFHLVFPDGEPQSGADAVLGLVRLLPAGAVLSTLVASAPGGRRMVGFVYSVFSRLHDAGACRRLAPS